MLFCLNKLFLTDNFHDFWYHIIKSTVPFGYTNFLDLSVSAEENHWTSSLVLLKAYLFQSTWQVDSQVDF